MELDHRLQRWRWRLLLIWILGFSIGMILLWNQQGDAARHDCMGSRKVITDILNISKKSFSVSPFYKAHPEYLKQATSEINEMIKLADPNRCQ